MKLYADTTNGVMVTGDNQYVTTTVTEDVFVESLSELSDDEYIMCENVSDETVQAIRAEWGIH